MTDSKFMRLLGLCTAAGKVVSGEDAVRIAVGKKKACLVVLDAQSAAGTRKKVESWCGGKVPLIVPDENVGKMVGHEGRMVAAVTDAGFAQALIKAYDAIEE